MPCAKPLQRVFLFTNHAPEQIVSGYENIKPTDHIVAVDSGLERIHELGLAPNLIIGDLDSVNPALLEHYSHIPLAKFSPEKNETDTELAIYRCVEMACYDELIICNDMQGRFDHVLAIVQNLLQHNKMQTMIRIETATQLMYFIAATEEFHNKQGQTLSLIPFSPRVEFASSVGLKYPLDGVLIFQHQSRGISNEIVSNYAHLVKLRGEALAIITISN
ncbi:MAG: thiamine diphosphokinase [Candidatus Cloacimonetes bacterium]|nr:thiamine diphosphokinase [Candidatus Cloacimonadota bacterium]